MIKMYKRIIAFTVFFVFNFSYVSTTLLKDNRDFTMYGVVNGVVKADTLAWDINAPENIDKKVMAIMTMLVYGGLKIADQNMYNNVKSYTNSYLNNHSFNIEQLSTGLINVTDEFKVWSAGLVDTFINSDTSPLDYTFDSPVGTNGYTGFLGPGTYIFDGRISSFCSNGNTGTSSSVSSPLSYGEIIGYSFDGNTGKELSRDTRNGNLTWISLNWFNYSSISVRLLSNLSNSVSIDSQLKLPTASVSSIPTAKTQIPVIPVGSTYDVFNSSVDSFIGKDSSNILQQVDYVPYTGTGVENIPVTGEYSGILDSLKTKLQDILDYIKSIPQTIIDGISSLFLPQENMTDVKEIINAKIGFDISFNSNFVDVPITLHVPFGSYVQDIVLNNSLFKTMRGYMVGFVYMLFTFMFYKKITGVVTNDN